MVKSKFPGKPSKIIQRSLVRAYSVAVPSCDSSVVSEEVFLGLSVFDQTFGVQDEISSFKGFSSAEIDRSFAKKEEFVNQVREKFAQRGVTLASSSSTKRCIPIASPCSEITISQSVNEIPKSDVEFPPLSCKRERRKCGKLWLLNKKGSRYHTKMPVRHNFKALSKNSLIRFKHKSSNYLSDKYCRKFVLPSRSVHSSRVIKPNKRFVDGDKNAKSKLLLKNFKTHKYETDAKSYVTNSVDKPQGSGANVIPSKVIIREARLNITTESAIAGPFSAKKAISFEKDKFKSGFITCGVCGVVRHYKYILQTKKFGIYSCEPCRRFILKMIKLSKQSYCEILKCKAENGIGKCLIDSGVMCQQKLSNDESPTKSSRCQACWLMLCLQKYMMPSTLRKTLVKLIPEELKIFSTCIVSIDLAKRSFIYEPDNSMYRVKNESEDTLKKRLRVNQFSKACSSGRRLLEKIDSTLTKSRPFLVRKSTSNHKLNAKNKWTVENSSKEHNEKELQVPRGPRIKHVCRSASSVLRTSLVSSNDMEEEDAEDRRFSAESDMNIAEYAESEDYKSEKYSSDDKCSSYGDNFENDECSIKKYGARTLQDFCKESHDKADDREDKLISIDFWEAYDPDEIFKIGFPLVGTESTNVRALCFLCGSAGQEKLLYCVSCCEAYHWYCAEGPSAFREEAELEKCRVNWVCRKCKVCSTCGERNSGALISCQRCRCSYHPECLTNKALNKRLFNSDRPWVCPSCLKCKSCNISSVFTFVGNVPLCSQCFKLRQKGNYCPLCQGCYEDEDYNVQMMECGVCKCWIHARCEGLSDEKYQILSFLPESIEFVCKLCCPAPPARWWLAVEDELKAGYLGILKKLCKNKQINELFKESPRKSNSCQCEQQQLPAQSPRSCSIDDLQQTSSPNADKQDAEKTKRCLNFVDETEEPGSSDEVAQSKADVAVDDEPSDGLDKSADPEKPLDNTTIKQCEICSSANELSAKINEGLLSVKSNVHNGRYTSLSAFHNDLENAIAQIDEGRLLQTYRDTLRTFFPWFDAENASCLNQPDNAVVEAQSNDASSGSEFEELVSVSDDEHYEHLRRLMAADDYPDENFRMLDVRVCVLCKAIGEAAPTEGGRLVYCGRNEWVHSNCALWSSEVFEEIDGSLQNVHSAITRGRRIRCSLCEKKGASIGCCYKNCGLTYHFVCAKKALCKFFHNKTIYCHAHDTPSEDPAFSLLANEKDFEILRPVYVEMDRKKKRLECHTNVKLRIGSLLVESLGRIDPHLSDHPKRIIPMQFRCTRLFWSTIKPWKIVQYCLQIKVQYSYDTSLAESESNYTIEHSTNEEIVQNVLEELVRKVCAADECRLCEANSVNGQSDLLFPELQDTIYKDLPTDVLNDHTLHDIWNNYDNADSTEIFNAAEDANVDFDTDSERNDSSDGKTSSVVNRKPKCLERRDSKAMKSRLGECFNGKYLRDKNIVIRDSAKQNYINNHWFKQLRGRVKRKMNFENSSQSARKKKYENYISPSKLDGALQYFSSYENILQLDGMVEIYSEEEPVKCLQCHRTYRTILSYERHLDTCNTDFGDFMISSCESDSASSEEDKYCTSADFVNVTNDETVFSAVPTNVDEYNIASQLQDDPFIAKYASNNACTTTYILDNSEKMLPAQSFNGTTNLCANVAFNGVYPSYTAAPYEDTRLVNNGCGGVIQNNAISLQTLLQNAVKQEPVTTVVSSPSIALHTVEPSTMKLNFVSNGNGLVASKACADYITTPQFAFSGANLQTQQYGIQNLAAPAYVIHQSYPKTDMIPTYVAVDNSTINDGTAYLSQPATTATLQLQQVPTASVNFQPMVPTILGTIVQPSIVETPTYIVNTAAPPSTVPAPTFAAAAPQSNIILPSQPVIFGLETVVSNTIMSSSQFLTQSPTGNVGASTMYSTTTTQVFQAAKPMPQPDLASSYIVLNPSTSVQPTPTILHTNVTQPTTVTSSAIMSTAKQLDPVVTSCPSEVGTYMYLHVNQSSGPVTNVVANAAPIKVERKKPPVIMKPVKLSSVPNKKSIKIMKVKNNRPVSIEVKHISTSADVKPATQLSNFHDEKAKKLQIKTTDKAIKLGQPVTQIQPVPRRKIPDFAICIKHGICRSSSCRETPCLPEKSPQINDDQKTVPPLLETTSIVTLKSEPVFKDVNSSGPPAQIVVPEALPQISQTVLDVKQEHACSLKPAGRSYLEFSSASCQVENAPAKSEPLLSTPQIDTHPKNESKELVSTQLPPLSKSTVVSSSSNKLAQSNSPSNEITSDRRNATLRTPSETERLFDELMRQHLENEQRRKQRQVETAAQPSMITVSNAESSLPALPSEGNVLASMPLLDDVKQYEPEKMECQSSNEGSASSSTSTEPSSSLKNAPLKFTLLKSKYKPRLQPRISEEGSVCLNIADKKVATSSTTAAKKLNKSPEKENKEVLAGNHDAAHKNWKTASISFEVSADDGFSYKTNDLLDLWNKILESVQQSRAKHKLPLLPKNASKDAESVYSIMGFENNASKYLMEQLPDAWKCIFYKPVFHKPPGKSGKTPLVENKTGCARSEPFASSHKYDMFGWLTSEHRDPPKFIMNLDSDIVNGNRRVTSPNLPMTMRFRNLKENAKKTVGVFRSDIHSRGLFCLRDIDAEEMVIEYAGEVIRSTLTDKREKYYTSKGIGCYMFRIDDRYVVDATMCGNAARFINHSCDPNCYSRIVDIHGKKHILIFALKRITKGVELTYDYKFPLEDEKIDCHCKSAKCRKYLN